MRKELTLKVFGKVSEIFAWLSTKQRLVGGKKARKIHNNVMYSFEDKHFL